MNPERSCSYALYVARGCLLFVVFSALIVSCGKQKEDKELSKEANAEKATENESRVKHGTNGEVIVTVEAKLQQTIGLETKALEPFQLPPEIKAYGRVLDPSPLAQVVADLMSVEAAGQASQAELKRLKTLATQNNASERALQAAEAAAVKDQAQIQSIRLKLLAGWGSAISQRNDLPDLVQSLATTASALALIEVPAGEMLSAAPTAARVYTLGQETNPQPAEVIGRAPMADPQMQGQGFLCLIAPNSSQLVPGASVTGLLSTPGEPRSGVLLPRSGVLWFNGSTWVFVQIAEDQFERREVHLDSPLPNGWFVAAGLKPQDKIVTTGAQQLLSEELKGQIEE